MDFKCASTKIQIDDSMFIYLFILFTVWIIDLFILCK